MLKLIIPLIIYEALDALKPTPGPANAQIRPDPVINDQIINHKVKLPPIALPSFDGDFFCGNRFMIASNHW